MLWLGGPAGADLEHTLKRLPATLRCGVAPKNERPPEGAWPLWERA